MTMYTSSEINVALRGNQTVSIYDIYIYRGGTTTGNLWKKINFLEDAKGGFNSDFQWMAFLLHENICFSLLESMSINFNVTYSEV